MRWIAAPALLALAACTPTPPVTPTTTPTATSTATATVPVPTTTTGARAWTVLVYMAADAADLAGPADHDLRAMEGAGASPRASVIVHLDRPGPGGIDRLEVGAPSKVIEHLPEETISTEESLKGFVSWGIGRYPADHYAVIVWGHGLGWRPAPEGSASPIRYEKAGASGGIAFDDTQGTVMDIPALARALGAASRDKLGGKPFDLYASDACLMQSIEVAGELSGTARFVVGSEQTEDDYVGLPYRAWIPMLAGSTPAPPAPSCAPGDVICPLAAALPALQGAATDPAPTERYTLSVLDEAAVDRDLTPAMRRVSAAADGYLREDPLRSINMKVTLDLEHGPLHGTPGFRGGTRDIGMLLARLTAVVDREPDAAGKPGTQALLAAVAEARTALKRAVVSASFGTRYRTAGYAPMAGLSLWIPHDADEYTKRGPFFAKAALYRGEPPFRAFFDRAFAGVKP